jgi:hypothetical protein
VSDPVSGCFGGFRLRSEGAIWSWCEANSHNGALLAMYLVQI